MHSISRTWCAYQGGCRHDGSNVPEALPLVGQQPVRDTLPDSLQGRQLVGGQRLVTPAHSHAHRRNTQVTCALRGGGGEQTFTCRPPGLHLSKTGGGASTMHSKHALWALRGVRLEQASASARVASEVATAPQHDGFLERAHHKTRHRQTRRWTPRACPSRARRQEANMWANTSATQPIQQQHLSPNPAAAQAASSSHPAEVPNLEKLLANGALEVLRDGFLDWGRAGTRSNRTALHELQSDQPGNGGGSRHTGSVFARLCVCVCACLHVGRLGRCLVLLSVRRASTQG